MLRRLLPAKRSRNINVAAEGPGDMKHAWVEDGKDVNLMELFHYYRICA